MLAVKNSIFLDVPSKMRGVRQVPVKGIYSTLPPSICGAGNLSDTRHVSWNLGHPLAANLSTTPGICGYLFKRTGE